MYCICVFGHVSASLFSFHKNKYTHPHTHVVLWVCLLFLFSANLIYLTGDKYHESKECRKISFKRRKSAAKQHVSTNVRQCSSNHGLYTQTPFCFLVLVHCSHLLCPGLPIVLIPSLVPLAFQSLHVRTHVRRFMYTFLVAKIGHFQLNQQPLPTKPKINNVKWQMD